MLPCKGGFAMSSRSLSLTSPRIISRHWNFAKDLTALPIAVLSRISLPSKIQSIQIELSGSPPPSAKLKAACNSFSKLAMTRRSAAEFSAVKQFSAKVSPSDSQLWTSSVNLPLSSRWNAPKHLLQWQPPRCCPSEQMLGVAIGPLPHQQTTVCQTSNLRHLPLPPSWTAEPLRQPKELYSVPLLIVVLTSLPRSNPQAQVKSALLEATPSATAITSATSQLCPTLAADLIHVRCRSPS